MKVQYISFENASHASSHVLTPHLLTISAAEPYFLLQCSGPVPTRHECQIAFEVNFFLLCICIFSFPDMSVLTAMPLFISLFLV